MFAAAIAFAVGSAGCANEVPDGRDFVDGTVGKADSWTEGGAPRDAGEATDPADAEVRDAPWTPTPDAASTFCEPGHVRANRWIDGGLGCLMGRKMQIEICAADGSAYVWQDMGPFDGSARACEPGSEERRGAGCNEEARRCDAATACPAAAGA